MLKKTDINILCIFFVCITGILISSCGFNEPISAKKITKDYYLHSVYNKSNQRIIKSSDDGKSGVVVVEEIVFALGYNDDFIIAKQHPNLSFEIGRRLFKEHKMGKGYVLENPSDTIYLTKEDGVYHEDGKWYHRSKGWVSPDSLKNYKKETIYHIVDIKSKEGVHFSFETEEGFNTKREELGVPQGLTFSEVDKELE